MSYFIAFVGLLLAEAPPARYARPELLVEPAVLLKARPGEFVLVDARGEGVHKRGHIPGAVAVSPAGWSKAFNAGEKAAAWSKRLGALGVDGKKPVVVYDAGRTLEAARVWWLLRHWGVADVRLLHGGYPAWLKAGGKPEAGAVKPAEVMFVARARAEVLATKSDLLRLLDSTPGQILDARSVDEFCGEAGGAKRKGHIPGAKHLEWSQTLDKDGRFKSAGELLALFRKAGIDPKRPTTTYCQSGGRAAVLAFVFELVGGRPARNYYRSWSEWGNDPATPVVVPPRPKK